MERALAVVEASESAKRLVREAGELASGVGAELVLLYVSSEEEYNETRQALADISDIDRTYTSGEALDGARQFAADIGDEMLDGLDVEYEAVGALGETETRILAKADAHGCDHLFIAGEKRSPTGKALFGDLTQSVILNFDGAVTVVTE